MFYTPVIILGAPRSGTNMLRDILTTFQGIDTWPCDEINHIWRYKNTNYESDELPARLASPSVKAYVRKQFDWVSKNYKCDFVIEKTCANTLRIPFVEAVVPEAKYIYIERNPLDAIFSSKLRWRGSTDFLYLSKKLRFVPFAAIPALTKQFLINRTHKFFSNQNVLKTWGPRISNMEELSKGKTLDEICATQWLACVSSAREHIAKLDKNKSIIIRYENFVENPKTELTKILKFLDCKFEMADIENSISRVHDNSVGKAQKCLNQKSKLLINNVLLESNLAFWGENFARR